MEPFLLPSDRVGHVRSANLHKIKDAIMTKDRHFPDTGIPGAGTAGSISKSRFVILVLLSALSVLPVNIISPSLPKIAMEFGVDFELISLAVAGYAIVTALVELISGAMLDRYGRRPVALVSLSLFILASIGCALAPDIVVFLVFRAMQASIAACFCVALVAIKETSNEYEGTSRVGYAAMAWALAPMLGPTLGGTLDELLGWRTIFVVLAAFGAIILSLSKRELSETLSPVRRSGVYLGSYGRLLSSVVFWAYIVVMASSSGILYIFLAGAPLVVGGSSALLGLFMGMVPAGFVCGSFLTGRYGLRVPRATLLIAARLLTCVGLLFGLVLSAFDMTHPLAFFGPCMFIGLGNGLTLPAANMGAMTIQKGMAGTAAGLAAAMSIGGGALIVAVAGQFLGASGTVNTLLSSMLIVSAIALAAAVAVAFVDPGSRRTH
ncbi:MFS transporter [Mesorhizobium sp. UC22_110]|jgi:predicted MFS family arabinose efflux permease|uniref:MFS transporter n=1 Tax=unclassified Mesorhizobium TaxID=325217 RepID=UPI003671E4EC